MNKNLLGILALAFAVLGMGSPLRATTFLFNSPTGQLGTSQAYTSGQTITAYGWGCFNTTDSGLSATSTPDHSCLSGSFQTHAVDLYGKQSGDPTENGLGIWKDPQNDHEISNDDFIDFDLSGVTATTGNWSFGSVQVGEQVEYCFGNSNTALNTSNCSTYTGSGTDPVTLSLNWTGFKDISVIAPTNDILVGSVTTTPEPGTLVLCGTGLLSMAGFLRRKLSA
jgi:hypothetical protein